MPEMNSALFISYEERKQSNYTKKSPTLLSAEYVTELA